MKKMAVNTRMVMDREELEAVEVVDGRPGSVKPETVKEDKIGA